jgi:amino acid adenylation domain-containing protein/thioester reductase-like protein
MENVGEFLNRLAALGVRVAVEDGVLTCYATKGVLTGDIKQEIAQRKLDVLTFLAKPEAGREAFGSAVPRMAGGMAGDVEEAAPVISHADRGQLERLPLSFAQERLWFVSQLEPGNTANNIADAIYATGELDIGQLEEAFKLVIARHENLRTIFPSSDGQARQVILDSLDFRLERIDVSHYAGREEREDKAKAICQADAAAPFDLALGPLIRGKVIKLSELEHVLMFNMHHIVTDGWSMGVLIKELMVTLRAFGEGRRPQLPPLEIQYADYSVWQRSWLEHSGMLRRQLAYWREKLAGAAETLDLPTDYPRPGVQSFAGAKYSFPVDLELTRQLKELAQQRGASLFMVLLAAFKVLLYRYTGQQDICVGTTIANRQHRGTEDLIGVFINTLALRDQVEGEDSFASLLSQVRHTCLEAYEHQDAPFEKVTDTLRPERNLASNPIFQVMLVLHDTAMGKLDERFRPYPLETVSSQFDLSLGFLENADGLLASIQYCTAVFKSATIERMAQHFEALCRAIVTSPTDRVRDCEFIGQAEKQVLAAFNDTAADYPRDKCIHQLFAEQALLRPQQTAVICGGRSLDYQGLMEQSCDLALYLQSQGIGPDRVVGLCMERSMEMMLSIMGTELAGGAYLPLDPVYPDDRLAYMLHDSHAEIVLTLEKFRNRLRFLSQNARLIALDVEWPEIARRAAELKAQGCRLREDVTPRNVAYVIYTSGSTGKPKGVMVEHQALVNRIHWMQKKYSLTADDRVLQKTPYSFDVSVWEFFWPLMAGASLVFAAPEGHKDVPYLGELINQASITTLHFVPSMLRAFLDSTKVDCDSVRQIFCSGEALDKKSVERYSAAFPNAALHNLYGPTEAAIDVTAFDCGELKYSFVPIGAPIDNTQIHILDQDNHLQPIGVPGELHIAGDGLARGYLNRPELTEQKFVANPFVSGARMYKTGDRARWMDDGNIQYLGRIDTQVKIRGIRIETGEIESRLNEHSQILDSAVIAQGQEDNRKLIAFYQAMESRPDHLVQISQEDLRAHLLRTLPDYMMPAAFVSLQSIPLSANGKVDRRALSRMDVKIASDRIYVAPRNPTEKQLVEIWAEVLNLPPETIGVDDNFFELGGHSLLAVKLIMRMRQSGLQSSVQTLFIAQTLGKLAASAKGRDASAIAADTAGTHEAAADPDIAQESDIDLDLEASLDAAIVPQTEGELGAIENVFLTGSTGFLGAFLLADLLRETEARVYCLVRAESAEAGLEKIEERMTDLGIWDTAFRDRIVAVVGDLASQSLGLSPRNFKELEKTIDTIYHCGAVINFYYPYSFHKPANVQSTEELLRMASVGKKKSLHFISTLSVALNRNGYGPSSVITERDSLPGAPHRADGYVQSKWVAEKLVESAGSRGIPVVTYRPGTIMGHTRTGATNLSDFVPSVIRGCMQARCVPDVGVQDELHLIPVDYVSRAIVVLSKRRECVGRVFNLTNGHGITGRDLLNHLLKFYPSLEKVRYESWRSQVASDPGNALARHIGAFPESVDEVSEAVWPRFDSEGTLATLEEAGLGRPQVTAELLQMCFKYIAEGGTKRIGAAAI